MRHHNKTDEPHFEQTLVLTLFLAFDANGERDADSVTKTIALKY